jgi:hypothetical protein
MDNAEILIPDGDNLVAQAELFISGYIEFDDNGFHITQKGYTIIWDYLKKLPPAKRLLFCLFFEYIDNVDYS